MKTDVPRRPRPVNTLRNLSGYAPPRAPAPTDLALDLNEGPPAPPELMALLGKIDPELISRYRGSARLQHALAKEHGVSPNQVLVTAGGDDAIDRTCRVYVAPDREVVVPTPTFEMICTFARLSGGRLRRVPWIDEPFPLDAVIDAVTDQTGVIAVLSPNNPTGFLVSPEQIVALAAAAPHAVVLIDLAYEPFSDQHLIETVIAQPNALAVFTLSKGLGMAGLRLGCLVGNADLVEPLRRAGGPFPVSNLSVDLATRWLDVGRAHTVARIARVRRERDALFALLTELGAGPLPGHGNFVFSRFADPVWVRDGLAGLGIAVRFVPATNGFAHGLRITCPSDDARYDRLAHALRTVLAPEALLFDMDGVVADVSASYREAIVATARQFGVGVTADDISRAKAAGDANDDWRLTHRLVTEAGIDATLEDVTARFERLYQGTPDSPGLREQETLLIDRARLARWAERFALGVVTGRPRADAERFLAAHGVAELFGAIICREDGPLKPDPAPVRLAVERLGVKGAWMLGDTVDDIAAARAAGVLPLAVGPGAERDPEGTAALHQAGAARVLADPNLLEDLLP